jgi:uncharacterized protein YqjF (DUF2071 family)
MLPGDSLKIPDTTARLLARSPNGRRRMVMLHRWENLLFLHWRISPERIQETLPPGLSVDTFQGHGYLGIVPFFMRNVRIVGTPSLPWFSFFQELNVRTYVFDREGIPGVWFYSLDCNRCWAVIGARLLGTLPYFLAEMSARRGEWTDYSCRRRGSSESARFRYRASGPNEETVVDSLEFFLLERYYLFAFRRKRGTLLRAQVTHAPYQFRAVDLAQFSTVPAQFNGFSEISRAPDHICVVDGFDINVFRQEKVRAGNAGKSTNAKASSVHLRS